MIGVNVGVPAPMAGRLFGTLRTESGHEFTGFVSWDLDEILTSDVLDGEDRGRDREVPFGRIAAIEREGSRGARVILQSGEEMVLRGSNDVDAGNRGITVADPDLGEVQVSWAGFSDLTLEPTPILATSYASFDGGTLLRGSVETEEGEVLTGTIRWDRNRTFLLC